VEVSKSNVSSNHCTSLSILSTDYSTPYLKGSQNPLRSVVLLLLLMMMMVMMMMLYLKIRSVLRS